MAKAVAVLTPNGTWVPLPYGEIPFGIVASGHPAFDAEAAGDLFFVLGIRNDAGTLAVADPAQLVAAASRLQVGIGSVQVPPGYRLGSSHYDIPSETVHIDLAGPNGAACSVTSTYVNQGTPDRAGLAPESLQNDGAATRWYRNSQGTRWRAGPATADSFDLDCSDPAVARALAASASFRADS